MILRAPSALCSRYAGAATESRIRYVKGDNGGDGSSNSCTNGGVGLDLQFCHRALLLLKRCLPRWASLLLVFLSLLEAVAISRCASTPWRLPTVCGSDKYCKPSCHRHPMSMCLKLHLFYICCRWHSRRLVLPHPGGPPVRSICWRGPPRYCPVRHVHTAAGDIPVALGVHRAEVSKNFCRKEAFVHIVADWQCVGIIYAGVDVML